MPKPEGFDPWLNPDPFEDPYPPDAPFPPDSDDGVVTGGPAAPPVPFDPTQGGLPPEPPDFGEFEIPQYGGPSSPEFNFMPPPDFNFPDFFGPSMADAENEPGMRFRLGLGREAIENSAAAKGALRTGGFPKSLINYNQNFGAQEYASLYNRFMQAYQMNRETAWQRYQPQLRYIETLNGAEKERALAEFNLGWQQYMAQLNATMQQEGWINALGSGEPPPQPPGY